MKTKNFKKIADFEQKQGNDKQDKLNGEFFSRGNVCMQTFRSRQFGGRRTRQKTGVHLNFTVPTTTNACRCPIGEDSLN